MPKKSYEKYENEIYSFRSPTETSNKKKNAGRSVNKVDNG